MKPKKLLPNMVKYFTGVFPIELSREDQEALLDNHYVSFEMDFNSEDITNLIKVIYDRDEIDLDVTQFKAEPVSTRISNFERAYKHGQDFWHCKFDLVKVRRFTDLDQVELEVIEERVKRIKEINDPMDTMQHARAYIPLMVKETSFDYQFGLEASVELINEYFYDIAERHQLNESELVDLADYVSQRESDDLLRDESKTNIFNQTDELNKQSVNEVRKLNLLKVKTNGKEYLRDRGN